MSIGDSSYIVATNVNTVMLSQLQENFAKLMSNIAQNCINFQMSSSSFNISNFAFVPKYYNYYSKTYTPVAENNSLERTYSKGDSNSQSHYYSSKYANLSKKEAYSLAANDERLENLSSGGRRWHISTESFINDIPFATKGTGYVLDKVASLIGEELIITSALGTKNSPHNKMKGHYAVENTKLDIRGDEKLAEKLQATGYFSHVLFEGDHIDVQISENAYQRFESIA